MVHIFFSSLILLFMTIWHAILGIERVLQGTFFNDDENRN
jgi:hypothetical protein